MILVEIYDVAGREEVLPISSKDVVAAVKKRNPATDIVYATGLEDAEVIIRKRAMECDAILVIGAGDVDELAKRLVGGR